MNQTCPDWCKVTSVKFPWASVVMELSNTFFITVAYNKVSSHSVKIFWKGNKRKETVLKIETPLFAFLMCSGTVLWSGHPQRQLTLLTASAGNTLCLVFWKLREEPTVAASHPGRSREQTDGSYVLSEPRWELWLIVWVKKIVLAELKNLFDSPCDLAVHWELTVLEWFEALWLRLCRKLPWIHVNVACVIHVNRLIYECFFFQTLSLRLDSRWMRIYDVEISTVVSRFSSHKIFPPCM